MKTIYRGYDICQGQAGTVWIYKGDTVCHARPFKTEEEAQDAIDKWKRDAARASRGS